MDVELGLLSLKWNNHKPTLLHIIGNLRNKPSYSDVTLACNGKFYPVHKLVLSTCSEYFCAIFEETICKNPVVVLKDVESKNLEYLLDYMYIGEVNVKQDELASLVKAAEYLKIKGLAIPDDNHIPKSNYSSKRQLIDSSRISSPAVKKKRTSRNISDLQDLTDNKIRFKSSDNLDSSSKPNFETVDYVEASFTPPRIKREPQSDDEIIEESVMLEPEAIFKSNCDKSACKLNEFNLAINSPKDLGKEEQNETSQKNIYESGSSEIYDKLENTYHPDSAAASSTSDASSFQHKEESRECQAMLGVNSDDMGNFIHSVIKSSSLTDQPNSSSYVSSSEIVNLNNVQFINYKDDHSANYQCSQCSFVTIYKNSAKDHARVHTGERPFKCKFCEFRTATQYTLTQHTRTHTGDTPYKCILCSYEAKQLCSLKLHQLNKHPKC